MPPLQVYLVALIITAAAVCLSLCEAQANSTNAGSISTNSTKSSGNATSTSAASKEYPAKSGIKLWVDPTTPDDRWTYKNSRGRQWDLVMSDEFNIPNRDFRPGKDHLWTSLEKPDGVNGALELYSHNMTSTACDADGTCYFYIKIMDEHNNITVYNMYTNPPGFQTVQFFYRAAMVQSWNKFCFQGGMLEVRAQLPGAVSNKSGNPDLVKGPNGKTTRGKYQFYPTWPGIWMLGNLGRAIFSASTNRMWPFSYDRCEPDVFEPKNQRISACDSNPGFGLNPNQGRGAPEIDVLEGGGVAISSSLQIAPGMPMDFRLSPIEKKIDQDKYCLYGASCKTPGANHPGVPTAFYNKRGHKSWYQGLRYQSNPFCFSQATEKQSYETVTSNIKLGIQPNTCTLQLCPGSRDVYADLDLVDGKGTTHWGINYNGTCFPVMNAYMGTYLCDPDNQNPLCEFPRPDNQTKTKIMSEFNYQMDAISSNWPVHVGGYIDYLVYQVEWVTGVNGYVRWMLDGYPIFEVTADSFTNVPQNANQTNPRKVMIEEPMYVIFNVALSSSWGATPHNTKTVCRGDGTDPIVNTICDEYPMYMKIDYIRLYQDLGKDLDKDNYMQVGCDPASHPTKEWINGHIDEYQDWENMMVEVAGGAICTTNDDCTVLPTGDIQYTKLVTGACVNNRCVCNTGESWGGPRCTIALDESKTVTGKKKVAGYGPPMEVAIGVAGLVVVLTSISVWLGMRKSNYKVQTTTVKNPVGLSPNDPRDGPAKVNYSQNFV